MTRPSIPRPKGAGHNRRSGRPTRQGDPLTPNQAEILGYIYGVIAAEGRRPTVRELMTWWGVSGVNAILGYLRALEKKGYLRRNPQRQGRVAALELVKLPDGSPFLGFLPVSRGPPNDTDRNPYQP